MLFVVDVLLCCVVIGVFVVVDDFLLCVMVVCM